MAGRGQHVYGQASDLYPADIPGCAGFIHRKRGPGPAVDVVTLEVRNHIL